MFKGSIVAIVTPFTNGRVDEQKLRELVDFQIDNGTDAIVACGTTGESSTLDNEEHLNVIRIVFEQAGGRVPVIAGTGSNSTAEAINLTREAKEIGVAGVPGSVFFPTPEHRYVRLNFAKRAETLHAAGERLLKLKRG